MRKLGEFKRAYLIFLCACIAISAVFLIYVYFIIREFDAAQPERIVEQQIEWLNEKAAEGSLARKLDFEGLCSNRYESNNAEDFGSAYTQKVLNSSITYEFVAAESGDMFKSYNILADGRHIGTVSLSGENSRTKLFFFSMADWSVESFDVIPSDTYYNLLVYRPEGIDVTINGIAPTDEELDAAAETTAYSIRGLLREPSIEYTRGDGSTIPYTTENNVVKPAVFNYRLAVPAGIKVSLNGKVLTGEASDSMYIYSIREMTQPEITFTDGSGASQSYNGGEVKFHPYTVVLPEACTLTVEGINADSFCTSELTAHPDADLLLEHAGVELPSLKKYSFALLGSEANAVVSDASQSAEYLLNEPYLEISTFGGSDVIPEDISSEVNVLEVARTWSKFMTDDLDGDQHGLETVYEFLIKGSDYYGYAYEWANGGDIKFTSPHTLDSFTNERVTDFVRYNDNCFSCKVYFEKNMSLIFEDRFAGARTDVFHSIMYFVYVDDTPDNGADDPHWAVAVMHDVL